MVVRNVTRHVARRAPILTAAPLALALLCVASLVSCGKRERTPEVLVLAAASVGDAVEDVARAFETDTGTRVLVSIGGSNALARQAIAGAPADLFLSASEVWGDEVVDGVDGARAVDLLTNRLVLVAPSGGVGEVRAPADLVRRGVGRVALAGEAVPAGVYAEQALRSLALWDAVEPRVVRGESVRFALAYVERAEADAAIVYATDAAASDGVRVVHEFAPEMHDPIVYPLVLLTEEGRGLFEFMQGPEAAGVFARHGFARINEGAGRTERAGGTETQP